MSDEFYYDTGCGCSKAGKMVECSFPDGDTKRMRWTTLHPRGRMHESEWVFGEGTRLLDGGLEGHLTRPT